MIIFQDGVPGAGKSYDTVAKHIVPAVQAGRKVYYRIKGLNHQAIADHLGMPLDQVNALLVHIPTDEVNKTCRAYQDPEQDNEWVCPAEHANALFVIDEVHEFWVTSRQPLHPAEQQWFAKHRHHGIDVVLMTQSYKELHSGVKRRIERMNRFQKLTAVGMEGHCRATRYHATAPEKFQEVSADTFKYDPVYFPMYKGYHGAGVSTAVYKAGGKTVWAKLRPYIIVMTIITGAGVYALWHFLHGGAESLVKDPHPPKAAPQSTTVAGQGVAPSPPAPTAIPKVDKPSGPDLTKMPPDVRYVFSLSEQGRARLAGLLTMDGKPTRGVVEWRNPSGGVVDRLDIDELQALGMTVTVTAYGLKLSWQKDTMIVTAWPLTDPAPQVDQPQPDSSGQTPGRQLASADTRGSTTKWPGSDSPIHAAYVPPELSQPESRSSWTPSSR